MSAPNGTPPGRNRGKALVTTIVLLLLAAGLALGYWWQHRGRESTDNAFVEASVVHVLPRVRGELVAVHVDDNQRVAAGELLFEIDPRDYELALRQARTRRDAARAALTEAQSQLALARETSTAERASSERALNVAEAAAAQARAEASAAATQAQLDRNDAQRVRDLFQANSASRQELDRAEAAAEASAARATAAREAVSVAKARVAQARAGVEQARAAARIVPVREAQVERARAELQAAADAVEAAQLQLSYTRVTAPQAGRITKLAVSTGDMAQPERPLTALVFGEPYVVANFKETQLTRMAPGQRVRIAVDAYPGQTLEGHVDSIQSGTGARFSLLPPENATGNYVKVVQRVPVKILIDRVPEDMGLLAPGMSVVPTVDVQAANGSNG